MANLQAEAWSIMVEQVKLLYEDKVDGSTAA